MFHKLPIKIIDTHDGQIISYPSGTMVELKKDKTITTFPNGTKIITTQTDKEKITETQYKNQTQTIRIDYEDGRKKLTTTDCEGKESITMTNPDGSKYQKHVNGTEFFTPPFLDHRINPSYLLFDKQKRLFLLKKNRTITRDQLFSPPDVTPEVRIRMLRDPIGEGSFSMLYLGQNIETGEWVAVKKFKIQERARFRVTELIQDGIIKAKDQIAIKKAYNEKIRVQQNRAKQRIAQNQISGKLISYASPLIDKQGNISVLIKLLKGHELFRSLIWRDNPNPSPQHFSFIQKVIFAKNIVRKLIDLHEDIHWIKQRYTQSTNSEFSPSSRKETLHLDLKSENIILNIETNEVELCDLDDAATQIKEFQFLKIVLTKTNPVENEIVLHLIGEKITALWREGDKICERTVERNWLINQLENKKNPNLSLIKIWQDVSSAETSQEQINSIAEIFGCAPSTGQSKHRHKNSMLIGTPAMIAPELLEQNANNVKKIYSKSTEVHALGMIFTELFNYIDYEYKVEINDSAIARYALKNKNAIDKNEHALLELITTMVSTDEKQRPSPQNIYSQLDKISKTTCLLKSMTISIAEFLQMGTKDKTLLIQTIIKSKINFIIFLDDSSQSDNFSFYKARYQLQKKNIINIAPFRVKGNNQENIAAATNAHYHAMYPCAKIENYHYTKNKISAIEIKQEQKHEKNFLQQINQFVKHHPIIAGLLCGLTATLFTLIIATAILTPIIFSGSAAAPFVLTALATIGKIIAGSTASLATTQLVGCLFTAGSICLISLLTGFGTGTALSCFFSDAAIKTPSSKHRLMNNPAPVHQSDQRTSHSSKYIASQTWQVKKPEKISNDENNSSIITPQDRVGDDCNNHENKDHEQQEILSPSSEKYRLSM